MPRRSKKRPESEGNTTMLAGRPLVVALGASAGGLAALSRFFEAMPADSGMAFVVVQHLDPDHESLTAELLGRRTSMPVAQVDDAPELVANHVYVAPPNRWLGVAGGRLNLRTREKGERATASIDLFLRALAADCGERCIGVVLSGSGSDGALGLREIKARGGMTLVQDPRSAEHAGMPSAAVATGAVDHAVAVEDMPALLLAFARHPYVAGQVPAKAEAPAAGAKEPLAEILAVLRARTRHDFSRYKKNMLLRRVQRRMGLRHIDGFEEYLKLLRTDEDEPTQLFKDLLIGVTGFFREPEAFAALVERVVPEIVDVKNENAPIRVWVPGCSTGEEAYSLAMVFLERLRERSRSSRLQIFASDIDEDALQTGRAGLYPESIAADVPPDRLQRFFAREPHGYRISDELREMVLFAHHNVIADPAFSRLDLVSCRNLLIYLDQEIQANLLTLFHFALSKGGYLFLGASETVSSRPELFEPVAKQWRIYRRIGETPANATDFLRLWSDAGASGRPAAGAQPVERRDVGRVAQQVLLRSHTPAAVLINRRLEVLYYHGDTGRFLQPPVGEPTAVLPSLARDALGGRVRAAARKAIEADAPVEVSDAWLKTGGGYSAVRITATPVKHPGSAEGLLLVTFEELPQPTTAELPARAPGDEPALRELELELKATREELESAIEELELSNEELKASNEEIMSINEELQSSNEELETSKEELQSLNEELLTVNSQLHAKVEELERANNDLSNLLASAELATIFLDSELHIKRFNEASAKVFNLRPADVGRPLADFALKLIDDCLLDEAQEVLDQLSPIQREISTPDGRWYERRIRPYWTRDHRNEGVVITFSDITEFKRVQAELKAANLRLQGTVDRRTSMIELLHRVAAEANRATSVEEAIDEILPRLARHFGAAWGQVWLLDERNEEELRQRGDHWQREPDCFASIDRSTPGGRAIDDDPAVRRVMSAGQAEWCDDLEAAMAGERAEAARQAGVRLALLLPILVRESAVGIVELLLEPTEERRQHMAELATSLGTEIGRVVERVGLQRKLSDLTSSEQRRLGQELHDTVAQEVAGIRMLAGALRQKIADGRVEPSDAEELLVSATRAQKHVKSIARGLVPVAVGAGGLRSALEQLAERADEHGDFHCRVRGFGDLVVEDSTLATNLYYIAQEAVRNAEQHGKPGEVLIDVDASDEALTLRISDDGKGFSPESAQASSGSGLRIMEYRARLIGAKLEVHSEPGRGTTVTCTVRRRPWGRGRDGRAWRIGRDDDAASS